MSLEDALNKWAKSVSGKSKIEAVRKEAFKTGKPFGGKPGGGASHEPKWYGDQAKRCLEEAVYDASLFSRYGYDFADHLVVSEPVWDEQSGKWIIELNFTDTERESLYPEKYNESHPDYITDIVALLNHGYKADGVVWGPWKSGKKNIQSLPERHGLYFIQAGATQFNNLYKEATMEWHPKYDDDAGWDG